MSNTAFFSSLNAPVTLPYSSAMQTGDNTIYISGCIGDDANGNLAEGVEAQTRMALSKMKNVLDAASVSFADVVKTTVLLRDMKDYAAVNQIYAEFFTGQAPARSCFAVAQLPRNALVEIEACVCRQTDLKNNGYFSEKNANPIGPYTSSIEHDRTLYISGCIGVTQAGQFAGENVEAQTVQALTNMANILEKAGYARNDVVKTTVLIRDMKDYGAVNEIYAKFFSEKAPGRSCFVVRGLPRDALVEIEAIAVKQDEQHQNIIISTDKNAKSIAPKSAALLCGKMCYLSGCTSVDQSGNFPGDDIESQTVQSITNMINVLEAAGLTLKDVVKNTILIRDMSHYAKVNEVYGRYFNEKPPARSCFAVLALPRDALIEIEAVAYKQN